MTSERIATGLYRHFPARAELVVAVYRHQVDATAEAGPELSRTSESAAQALHAWVDLFAAVLHRYCIERLVPVCADLLQRAAPDGSALTAFALLRGVGNLCIGGPLPRYDPALVAHVLVDGSLRSG